MKRDIKEIVRDLSSDEIEHLINELLIIKEKKIDEEGFIANLLENMEERGIDPNKIAYYLNKKEYEIKKAKKVKYRLNQDGKEYSYSGLGKKPKWFIDFINKGGNIKDIEVL